MGFQARSRSVAKIKEEVVMKTYSPENTLHNIVNSTLEQ
jgi:hypothetical protein